MPKVAYVPRAFGESALGMVKQANAIITEYAGQGFVLTLRQLYYQFVARALIRNLEREYKRLGNLINDARLAGLIDWNAIVDRTRQLRDLAHWNGPASLIESAAEQYRTDRWASQKNRIEVWIEKDALVGVIENVCEEHDVPFFSCRGYTSQSELWGAAMRLLGHHRNGQLPVILHFGDHDPSGLDMSRDIEDRLRLFMGHHLRRQTGLFEFRRLALNFDQVERYQPPPNPAKVTDSRFAAYQTEHGDESWELDALEPSVLAALITDAITEYIDAEAWDAVTETQETNRELLKATAEKWSDVARLVVRVGAAGRRCDGRGHDGDRGEAARARARARRNPRPPG